MSRDTITALRQQLDAAIAARIEELLGTRKAIDAELAELRGHRVTPGDATVSPVRRGWAQCPVVSVEGQDDHTGAVGRIGDSARLVRSGEDSGCQTDTIPVHKSTRHRRGGASKHGPL